MKIRSNLSLMVIVTASSSIILICSFTPNSMKFFLAISARLLSCSIVTTLIFLFNKATLMEVYPIAVPISKNLV